MISGVINYIIKFLSLAIFLGLCFKIIIDFTSRSEQGNANTRPKQDNTNNTSRIANTTDRPKQVNTTVGPIPETKNNKFIDNLVCEHSWFLGSSEDDF